MDLKTHKELEMKIHEKLYNNVYLLTIHYPPSQAFVEVFKKCMFLKNNKVGSQQVIYYLLEILDKGTLNQKIKNWPILDSRNELEFRKEILKYINELNTLYEDADIPSLTASHLIAPGGFKFIKFMFKLSQFVLFVHLQRNPNIYSNMMLPLKPSKKCFITKTNIDKTNTASNTIRKGTRNLKENFENVFEDAKINSSKLLEEVCLANDDYKDFKIKLDKLREEAAEIETTNNSMDDLHNKLLTLKLLKEQFQYCQLLRSHLENPLKLEHIKEVDTVEDPTNQHQISDNILDLKRLMENFILLSERKYLEVKPPSKDSLQMEVPRFNKLNERLESTLKDLKIVYKDARQLSEKLQNELFGKSNLCGTFKKSLNDSDSDELAWPLSDSA